MKLRALAEMMILQAIEDLTHHRRRAESMEFFASDNFLMVARAAGMDADQSLKMLEYVCKINYDIQTLSKKQVSLNKVSLKAGRARTSPRALPAPSLSF